jgi:hypothetical protein
MNDDLTVHAEHSEFALPVASLEPHKTLDIPPQLVLECAAGLEDPAVVADRFGFRGDAWERLAQWPPFITAVQAQRAEFERNGYTFRMKAQLMAEEVMGQMFKQAVGTDTTILQKLSVFNSLVDVAGLKAQKKEESAGQAAKFSITINIPQSAAPTPITIDG